MENSIVFLIVAILLIVLVVWLFNMKDGYSDTASPYQCNAWKPTPKKRYMRKSGCGGNPMAQGSILKDYTMQNGNMMQDPMNGNMIDSSSMMDYIKDSMMKDPNMMKSMMDYMMKNPMMMKMMMQSMMDYMMMMKNPMMMQYMMKSMMDYMVMKNPNMMKDPLMMKSMMDYMVMKNPTMKAMMDYMMNKDSTIESMMQMMMDKQDPMMMQMMMDFMMQSSGGQDPMMMQMMLQSFMDYMMKDPMMMKSMMDYMTMKDPMMMKSMMDYMMQYMMNKDSPMQPGSDMCSQMCLPMAMPGSCTKNGFMQLKNAYLPTMETMRDLQRDKMSGMLGCCDPCISDKPKCEVKKPCTMTGLVPLSAVGYSPRSHCDQVNFMKNDSCSYGRNYTLPPDSVIGVL